jgi:hypothetical protein
MKTPRELLRERHQAAVPKLDAIRHEVVNAEFREGRRAAVPKSRVAGTATLPFLLWRELILPSRRIWAGLATVWLLIFAVNLSMRDPSQMAAAKSAPSPQMMLTFRQQQRLLTELIGPDETTAARPATPFLPQPRSKGRLDILMT